MKKKLVKTYSITTTELAVRFGLSAQELNRMLHKLRIHHKRNNQWVLSRKYRGFGFKIDEKVLIIGNYGVQQTVINSKWTLEGVKFVTNTLKHNGYEPKEDL